MAFVNLLDVIYPVGSIYQSTSAASPASIIGGTWTQITDRFLMGAAERGEAGMTGGATRHSHQLSYTGYANMNFKYSPASGGSGWFNIGSMSINAKGYPGHPEVSAKFNPELKAAMNLTTLTHSAETTWYGASLGGTTNPYMDKTTLPPYYTCYIWVRTA